MTKQKWLSGTMNDSFTLTMNAGFAFKPNAPSYDTSPWTVGVRNSFWFEAASGVAPRGGNNSYGNNTGVGNEITIFTIGGLEAGQKLKLTGCTLNGSGRLDLYYGSGLTVYDTSNGSNTGLNIQLQNGDKFAIAYNYATGAQGFLQDISFDIIPEPATLGMIVAMSTGMLWIRRSLMM